MPSPRLLAALCLTFALNAVPPRLHAQTFDPSPRFDLPESHLTIHQSALPNHPFTVTGRSGAILGMQDGTVELWQLPVKFFSALHLRAELQGYSAPIDLNPLAAELTVSPDHTTLTYAHPAITVRQHMFVPAGPENEGRGGIILFEIQSILPATLTVSLTPAMIRMWPSPQWGQPGWDWLPIGSGGAYAISTDNPELFGLIGMPGSTSGAISPYQEHPHTLPIEFRVHFDPKTDANHLFPLLCEVAHPGETLSSQAIATLRSRLTATAADLPSIYARTQAYYDHFFDHRTVTHTPDPRLDAALQWAELSIDKAQATIPASPSTPAETGLVAGWFPSFDSARPGFGWFFGRDTLWSMYAIDSYGDAALAREALTFLIRRQRADGKMPHEFSQTAGLLTGDMAWNKLPYEYAAADATPLFLLAMQDYLRATGDLAFLQQNWDAVQKAYHFERAHDSDGDGVYDNSEGTGWVEGWPPKLPHQELYLAALDRDATYAFASLAERTSHLLLSTQALASAVHLEEAVAAYKLPTNLYAFSENADHTYDPTSTIYPAVAFWLHPNGLPDPHAQLDAWAGHHFQTDWGTRALSDADPTYDPISYHQGTVWPLFTGWNAMAQYRNNRPLVAYAALRQNLGLTWAQDPGAVTEVLSGRFYQPLGRSSTHQLWSSAMALAPALRELFGLEPDAPSRTLLVHPHLPPAWNEATLDHVHIGDTELTLTERREGPHLQITAAGTEPAVLCLAPLPGLSLPSEQAETPSPRSKTEGRIGKTCSSAPAKVHTLTIPLSPLEIYLPDQPLPTAGSETTQPHIVDETYTLQTTTITVEALASTTVTLHLRLNGPAARNAQTTDATLTADTLTVTMPPGTGFVQKRLTLAW